MRNAGERSPNWDRTASTTAAAVATPQQPHTQCTATHLHCRHQGADAGACSSLQGLSKASGRLLLQPPGLRCLRGIQHHESHKGNESQGVLLHHAANCEGKNGEGTWVLKTSERKLFMRFPAARVTCSFSQNAHGV
jgi:hypothetical protein